MNAPARWPALAQKIRSVLDEREAISTRCSRRPDRIAPQFRTFRNHTLDNAPDATTEELERVHKALEILHWHVGKLVAERRRSSKRRRS